LNDSQLKHFFGYSTLSEMPPPKKALLQPFAIRLWLMTLTIGSLPSVARGKNSRNSKAKKKKGLEF